jgi:fengycin family lipopeptide synthetase D
MQSVDDISYQQHIAIPLNESKGIRFIYSSEEEEYLSYLHLFNLAKNQVAFIKSFGVKPEQKVVLWIRSNKHFLINFHACLLGGFIPVPLSRSEGETAILKMTEVYNQLNGPFVISDESDLSINGHQITTISASGPEMPDTPDTPDLPHETAFIQYSSGSTGSPKGIVLTHRNLTSNINAMLSASATSEADTYLSWMPLSHDMGLIGFHLTPLQKCVDQIIMDTQLFVRKPHIWLQKASELRATILCSPNFGYEHVIRQWKLNDYENLDLAKVRIIYNGAEPISTALARKFLNTFCQYGLRKESMLTVYGLAEGSLAVSIPPLDQMFLSHSFDRHRLGIGDLAVESNDEHSICFADVGYPVPECAVEIYDERGNCLADNTVGIIHIKGKNVTTGYLAQNGKADFPGKDGWLNTGDMGLIKNGRIIVTGRVKDIVFVNGQNLYPHDIEASISSRLQIETSGKVAVSGYSDPVTRKEVLLVFLANKRPVAEFISCIPIIKHLLAQSFGIERSEIIPVKSIQKTTSGKIQRFFHARQFEEGRYKKVLQDTENAVTKSLNEEPVCRVPNNDTEWKLSQIWGNVLGQKDISLDDNLLNSGGSSIQIIQIISRIKTYWNVHLTFQQIFDNLTIRKLSRLIDQLQKSASMATDGIIKDFEIRTHYPLSNAQKQFWLLNQIEQAGDAYTLSTVNRLTGDLNKEAFFNAFGSLFERHEILRTAFVLMDGEPMQEIRPFNNQDTLIEEKDLRGVTGNEIIARQWIQEKLGQPFDLTNPPLLRAGLVRLVDDKYLFVLVIHHIIADGWSMSLLIREIQEVYNALRKNTVKQLTPLLLQYKDYCVWQINQNQADNFDAHKKYWLEKLSGKLPVLALHTDRRCPKVQTFNGAKWSIHFSPDTSLELNKWCSAHDTTLFMTLLAGLKILFYRYTGQTDILIGSTTAGRHYAELEDQLGCFLNTIFLRTELNPADSFKETVDKVKTTTLGAYQHQEYPSSQLVENLNLVRDTGRSGVFDVMMILQSSELQLHGLNGLDQIESEFVSTPQLKSKFDLTFDFIKCADYISLSIEYNTDLYNENSVFKLAENLESIIRIALSSPEVSISQLDYLAREEKDKLLNAFNSSAVIYPYYNSIIDLLDLQLSMTPGNVALQFGDLQVTYQQLHERSNQIAQFLKKHHQTGPEDRVAIIAERGADMIAGLFGIIKSEAAYVPIDPEYPLERISFILSDSDCKAVLTDSVNFQRLVHHISCPCILIADRTFEGSSKDSVGRNLLPGHLAYIIYTSGSTGKPKGVMVEHQSLLNFVQAAGRHYNIDESDRVLQFASLSFDTAIEEIFPCLCAGGTLVLRTADMLNTHHSFIEKCLRWRITVLDLPTAFWASLTEEIIREKLSIPESIRLVIIGGEEASFDTLSKWKNLKGRAVAVMNTYGPTEATVIATIYSNAQEACQEETQHVLIGKPISNTKIYLMDEMGQLLPVGVPGEICIAGVGIARGYNKLPDLTAKVFVENPFGQGKLYKTGDTGRWLSDGNVEFLGRKDDQIKIRGFRIEPSEIERVLSQHPDVERAVVLVTKDNHDENYLIAYIQTNEEKEESFWRNFLKQSLPAYMVPVFYIRLDKFPVTVQGKIDKKALPLPVYGFPEVNSIVLPKNPVEMQLLEIWKQVLKKTVIDVTDNFFAIGGHSLKAMQVLSKIHKELDRNVNLRMLFTHPSIREMAELIAGIERKEEGEITALGPQEHYQMSSAQNRLWILDQLEENSTAYNLSGTYSLTGNLDIVIFREAYCQLIRRHEILRTRFVVIDGIPMQKPEAWGEKMFGLETENLSDDPDVEAKLINSRQIQVTTPFDLANGPLLRAKLVTISANDHVLLFSIHHIISDGWSMEVLLSEISILYNSLKRTKKPLFLAPLRIQYKEYAFWQRNELTAGNLKNQRAYWLSQLGGVLPVINLATDYTRPTQKTYKGGLVNFTVDKHKAVEIGRLAVQGNATLFMFLLSLVKALFYKYTDQTDIIIGSPVAGREHSELDGQIGFYVNTLALRTRFEHHDSFLKLLELVREVTLDAYLNQSYPFDQLVEDLDPPRDISKSVLFDVMVVLQDSFLVRGESDKMDGIKITRLPTLLVTSKFDITYYFTDEGEEISVSIEYNSDLFDRESIERMSSHFQTLLDSVILNPENNLNALDYLPAVEVDTLLYGFNPVEQEYQEEQTIMQLWEHRVAKFPDRPAVSRGNTSLTYHELNQKANQLAHYLTLNYDILRGDKVAILLDRSEYTIIVIFAILKSGAAYVPIDPKLPSKRVEYMVSDSDARVLITTKSYAATTESLEIVKIYYDDFAENIAAYSRANPVHISLPQDPVYVMYTSGSTGKPKGVVVSNVSVNNLLSGLEERYPMKKDDVYLLKTSFSFDVSITEIFGWFFGEGSVAVLEKDEEKDPLSLLECIYRQRITHINFSPSMLGVFLENIGNENRYMVTSLKYTFAAGEALSPGVANQFLEKIPSRLENLYGPTEATVYATGGSISADGLVTIGKPLRNTNIFILGANDQLQGIGIPGQLCIGGAGISTTYHKNVELTNEKFVANPFLPETKVYKTGDLAKWLSDGTIMYLGRMDNQIKVRGYRVEPGEIETVIKQHGTVKHATVLARKDSDGNNELIAFYVADQRLKITDVRDFLRTSLPEYMIPAYLVQLDNLPLNTNGKVDRKALTDLIFDHQSTSIYTAPRDAVERKLAGIWEEVLGKGFDQCYR